MSLTVSDLVGSDVELRQAQSRQQSGWKSYKSLARKWVFAACGVVDRLPNSRGLLLSFDDGPNPDVTPGVLDLLREFDAKAVFFVIGDRVAPNSELLRRIVREGHLIGNHTYRHPLRAPSNLFRYYRELQLCQAVVESHTGVRPTLFRPPFGSSSFGSLVVPKYVGLKTILWSVDVGDWRIQREADAVQAGHRLAETAGPGDIVLLHDDNPCAMTLLKIALSRYRERQIDLCAALVHIESIAHERCCSH